MGDDTKRNPPIGEPDDGGTSDDRGGNEDSRQSDVGDYTDVDSSGGDDKQDSSDRAPGSAGGASGGGLVGVETPQSPGANEESEQPEGDETAEPDDDTEEEENETVQIIQHTDPWDNVGWGLYPVFRQLKEEYGDQIEFDYRPAPVREFESSEEMASKWESDEKRHGMPVNSDVWQTDPPSSTELSNRAFAAARKQGRGGGKEYLRRLRVAAIVEGRNIEDKTVLIDLGRESGLDTDRLRSDIEDGEAQGSRREIDLPETIIHIDGATVRQSGYLHPDDLKMMFEQAGLEEKDPQPLQSFVEEYAPVAVKEVMQVYGLSQREATEKLQDENGIESVKCGETAFWRVVEQ